MNNSVGLQFFQSPWIEIPSAGLKFVSFLDRENNHYNFLFSLLDINDESK